MAAAVVVAAAPRPPEPPGPIVRVSVDSNGAEADNPSFGPVVSGDGRHVALDSLATQLVAGDTNGWGDVFVRHTQTGTTTRESVDSSGGEGDFRHG